MYIYIYRYIRQHYIHRYTCTETCILVLATCIYVLLLQPKSPLERLLVDHNIGSGKTLPSWVSFARQPLYRDPETGRRWRCNLLLVRVCHLSMETPIFSSFSNLQRPMRKLNFVYACSASTSCRHGFAQCTRYGIIQCGVQTVFANSLSKHRESVRICHV